MTLRVSKNPISVGPRPRRAESRTSHPLGLSEDFGLNFTGSLAGMDVVRFQTVGDPLCLSPARRVDGRIETGGRKPGRRLLKQKQLCNYHRPAQGWGTARSPPSPTLPCSSGVPSPQLVARERSV